MMLISLVISPPKKRCKKKNKQKESLKEALLHLFEKHENVMQFVYGFLAGYLELEEDYFEKLKIGTEVASNCKTIDSKQFILQFNDPNFVYKVLEDIDTPVATPRKSKVIAAAEGLELYKCYEAKLRNYKFYLIRRSLKTYLFSYGKRVDYCDYTTWWDLDKVLAKFPHTTIAKLNKRLKRCHDADARKVDDDQPPCDFRALIKKQFYDVKYFFINKTYVKTYLGCIWKALKGIKEFEFSLFNPDTYEQLLTNMFNFAGSCLSPSIFGACKAMFTLARASYNIYDGYHDAKENKYKLIGTAFGKAAKQLKG
jgi:hypothetical protein